MTLSFQFHRILSTQCKNGTYTCTDPSLAQNKLFLGQKILLGFLHKMHLDKYRSYPNCIFTFYEYVALPSTDGVQVNFFLEGLLAFELNASLTTPLTMLNALKKYLLNANIPLYSCTVCCILYHLRNATLHFKVHCQLCNYTQKRIH